MQWSCFWFTEGGATQHEEVEDRWLQNPCTYEPSNYRYLPWSDVDNFLQQNRAHRYHLQVTAFSELIGEIMPKPQLWTAQFARITMSHGCFPCRHLGNKLYPATGCGRWWHFIGCRKTWRTDQKTVHPNWRKELHLNRHCCCARGFKDSKRIVGLFSALQGQRHSWLLEEFISGLAVSHSVY